MEGRERVRVIVSVSRIQDGGRLARHVCARARARQAGGMGFDVPSRNSRNLVLLQERQGLLRRCEGVPNPLFLRLGLGHDGGTGVGTSLPVKADASLVRGDHTACAGGREQERKPDARVCTLDSGEATPSEPQDGVPDTKGADGEAGKTPLDGVVVLRIAVLGVTVRRAVEGGRHGGEKVWWWPMGGLEGGRMECEREDRRRDLERADIARNKQAGQGPGHSGKWPQIRRAARRIT